MFKKIFIGICVVILVAMGVWAASPPTLMNYQGKLTDANNVPVDDGTYSIVFSIYDDPSAGSTFWTETRSVSTESGFFNVLLGENTAIDGDIFATQESLYIGIKVGADAEMTPRQRIVTAGYAFNADTLDGYDSTDFITQEAASNLYVLKTGDEMSGILSVEVGSSKAYLGRTSAGVRGEGAAIGIQAYTAGSGGIGVYSEATGEGTVHAVDGQATNTGDYENYGGYFQAEGQQGRGIFGFANNNVGANYGGYFRADGSSGVGVYGEGYSVGSVANVGGYFVAKGNSAGAKGISAEATGVDANYGGFFVTKSSLGMGLYATSEGSGFAASLATPGWAGYFEGPVNVVGSMTASSYYYDNGTSLEGRYVEFEPVSVQTASGDNAIWVKATGTPDPVVSVEASGDGTAVFGRSFNGEKGTLGDGTNNAGVRGDGTVYGVYGRSNNASSYGVYGESGAVSSYGLYGSTGGDSSYGVYGVSTGAAISTGVYGSATNTSANVNYGGRFSAAGINSYAVYGNASNASGNINYGGHFSSAGTQGAGVYGFSAYNYGGQFMAGGLSGIGLYAKASGSTGFNYGAYIATRSWQGTGLLVSNEATTGNNYYVKFADPTWAGNFSGPVNIDGDLNVTGVATASAYYGDGQYLTGISSGLTTAEADDRYVNETGDTMIGDLTIEADLYVTGTIEGGSPVKVVGGLDLQTGTLEVAGGEFMSDVAGANGSVGFELRTRNELDNTSGDNFPTEYLLSVYSGENAAESSFNVFESDIGGAAQYRGIMIPSKEGSPTFMILLGGDSGIEGIHLGDMHNNNTIRFSGTLEGDKSITIRSETVKIDGATIEGHFIPSSNNNYDLGQNGAAWNNVWAQTYYGDGSNLTGINTDLSGVVSFSAGTPQVDVNMDPSIWINVTDASGLGISVEAPAGGSPTSGGIFGRGSFGVKGVQKGDENIYGVLGSNRGVYGQYSSTIYGDLGGPNYGVYGYNNSGSGAAMQADNPFSGHTASLATGSWAGYFNGPVNVVGSMTATTLHGDGSNLTGIGGNYVLKTGDTMTGTLTIGVSSGHGVSAVTSDSAGRGVYGQASATGAVSNIGGYFAAGGDTGRGVYGYAYATGAVINYGGRFTAAGDSGRGIYSISSGSSGRGVEGYASATGVANNYGGSFSAAGESGRGVYGHASSASGTTYGGYFDSNSPDGYGVYSVGRIYATQTIEANSDLTIAGDLTVTGTISGGSPVKIAGGIELDYGTVESNAPSGVGNTGFELRTNNDFDSVDGNTLPTSSILSVYSGSSATTAAFSVVSGGDYYNGIAIPSFKGSPPIYMIGGDMGGGGAAFLGDALNDNLLSWTGTSELKIHSSNDLVLHAQHITISAGSVIDVESPLISVSSIAAVTYYGDGSNLTGIGGNYVELGPTSVQSTTAAIAISVEATGSGGYGLFAKGDNRGVFAIGDTTAIYGINGTNSDTYGYMGGTAWGLYGRSGQSTGRGVVGYTTSGTGATYGGYFMNYSSGGTGVYAENNPSGNKSSLATPSWAGYFEGPVNIVGSMTATTLYGDGSNLTGISGGSGNYVELGPTSMQTTTAATAIWVKSDSLSGRAISAEAAGAAAVAVYARNSGTSGQAIKAEGGQYAVLAQGAEYGVYGQSTDAGGYGIYGIGTNAGGHGVYGMGSSSTGGYGVYGYASSTLGINYGVYGESNSQTGYGVFGQGAKTGGRFRPTTDTSGSWGLRAEDKNGDHQAFLAGTEEAAYFINDVVGGSGVSIAYWDIDESGPSYGIKSTGVWTYSGYFETSSNFGRGVYGIATDTSSTGQTYGGYFVAKDKYGIGLFATAEGSNGVGVSGQGLLGVFGKSDAVGGGGVYGYASASDGSAVMGAATSSSGVNYGGKFMTNSSDGYGLLATNEGSGAWGYVGGLSHGAYGRYNSTNYGRIGATNFGVAGNSNSTYGVYGATSSTEGYALYGYASAVSGTNYGGYLRTKSSDGYGLLATNEGTGMYGFIGGKAGINSYSVYGQNGVSIGYLGGGSAGAYGQTGSGTYGYLGFSTYGVYGYSNNTSGHGVRALAAASTGTNYGVRGKTNSSSGYGVHGESNSISRYGYLGGPSYGAYGQYSSVQYGRLGGSNFGVYGSSALDYGGYFTTTASGSQAVAVVGYASASGGGTTNYGGRFQADGLTSIGVAGLGRTGVYAIGSLTGVLASGTALGEGVRGEHAASGAYGELGQSNVGVYGNDGASAAYAGYFDGDLYVNGTLAKASGSFLIDHPLDPENKVLRHSFVESPDMKNVYDGVVILDKNGEATVDMPDYFGALNKDFRYQLTCVGDKALIYIKEKIKNNKFTIAGGKPEMEVCWQVTGIRQDAYALKNPIIVEEVKEQKGIYLHPEAFDKDGYLGREYLIDEDTRAMVLKETGVFYLHKSLVDISIKGDVAVISGVIPVSKSGKVKVLFDKDLAEYITASNYDLSLRGSAYDDVKVGADERFADHFTAEFDFGDSELEFGRRIEITIAMAVRTDKAQVMADLQKEWEEYAAKENAVYKAESIRDKVPVIAKAAEKILTISAKSGKLKLTGSENDQLKAKVAELELKLDSLLELLDNKADWIELKPISMNP
jgi:hypothetical protein